MTIVDAIQVVLAEAQKPLGLDDIYGQIRERSLYEFSAADPKAVVRSQIRRHCVNLDFASASPIRYFRVVDGSKYIVESKEGVRATLSDVKQATSDQLPEETIAKAHADHLRMVRQSLKERILANHFAFFERLVISLLIRVGYGGSDPNLGFHTGGPGDEGIDGVIWEDRLGLGRIFVQAKRYKPEHVVSPKEVREFAGAMVHVDKGVFITTSSFAPGAQDLVDKHEKSIRLINGDELCDLMIKHGVGVSQVESYSVIRVDSDFFSEE